jgi:hypothetical protein
MKHLVKIKVDTDLDGSLLFMLAEAPDNIEVIVFDSKNVPMTAGLTNENHGGPECPRCHKYSEGDAICPNCKTRNALDEMPHEHFRFHRNKQMGEQVREALENRDGAK